MNEQGNFQLNYGKKDIIISTKISGIPCTVINTPYVEKIGTQQNFIEKILNKRSTTWRNLSESLKNNFEKNYIKIIIKNTSLIKRPIWEFKNLPERELTPGFDKAHQNFILKIK